MKKLIWLTDTHLDYLDAKQNGEFFAKLVAEIKLSCGTEDRHHVVISGDIAEGYCTLELMEAWQKGLDNHNIDLSFVLGNHDYYEKSIVQQRLVFENSSVKNNFLTIVPFKKLTETSCILGSDGWWDGGYCNWFMSKLDMQDYHCITEINKKLFSYQEIYARINQLATDSAKHIVKETQKAIKNGYKNIWITTHVPPFKENSVYNGKISDQHWLPHFSSKKMGDAIMNLARTNYDINFTVLCGHSHGWAEHRPIDNLVCYTGDAKHKFPKIVKIFDLI